VDAIFTPVRKVNYTIEPLQVGEQSSHERLNLEIWTDRTIEPGEAITRSASILISMLNAFVNYGTTAQVEAEKEYAELAMSEEQYNMPVEQLSLSVRTMNCLRRGNISTVGELISRGEKGLLALRNFGQKSKQEIEERLNELGLSLNPVTEEAEEPSGEGAEDVVTVAAEAKTSGAEGAAQQGESPEEEQ
jgi:DNA-directed RNA polymerase subunit alpha